MLVSFNSVKHKKQAASRRRRLLKRLKRQSTAAQFVRSCAVREPNTEPETVADLLALATSVAAYTSAAGCHPESCTILVTNFTLPDGNTSAYGMELADQLSGTLAGKEYQLKVIDRALLQSFLAKDRIPDRSINREVILSIGETLDSRFMLVGTTEKFANGVVSLSSKVIDVAAKDWDGHNAVVNFGRLNLEVNLEPIDPLPPLPAITSSLSGERLQRAGVDGTSGP